MTDLAELASMQRALTDAAVTLQGISNQLGDLAAAERKEHRAELKLAELQRDNDRLKEEVSSLAGQLTESLARERRLVEKVDSVQRAVAKLTEGQQ